MKSVLYIISLPIMLALCLMLLPCYYAQNYAGIIGSSLLTNHHTCEENKAIARSYGSITPRIITMVRLADEKFVNLKTYGLSYTFFVYNLKIRSTAPRYLMSFSGYNLEDT